MKKLIVITPPAFFPGEEIILTRLFDEGMQRLHIRKPGCSLDNLDSLLKVIPTDYHSRIVLHDCFELTTPYTLGGIHINQRNLQIPPKFEGSISRSCHTLQEVQDNNGYDYLFLSPIFQSISKEGYGCGFTMEVIENAFSQGVLTNKVIALGGMNESTIRQIQHLDFGGYAVLGALWGKNPTISTSDIIIKQYKQLQLCL